MGQKPAHAYVVRVLMAWLSRVFGENSVQSQLPIHIVGEDAEHNEPEPDCAVLSRPADAFADHHPTPAELLLVVEVADTSINFDFNAKRLVYGRAGIAEYWIVDLAARRMVVLREPGASGYASIVEYAEGEAFAPLASPASTVRPSDLLPPESRATTG
jgi:Uma2 family endonuclease